MKFRITPGLYSLLILLPLTLRAEIAVLEPTRDNTIFSDGGLALSNGAGDYLFAGAAASSTANLRRTLLGFDFQSIPSGATVTSVELALTLSRVPPAAPTSLMSLHRLTQDWGEGASDALGQEGAGIQAELGDATWSMSQFPATAWVTAGGDFLPTASASTQVGVSVGQVYRWSDAGLVLDVQAWLNGGAPNFGWILLGDESSTRTAKRFLSRSVGLDDGGPRLTIEYTTAVPEPAGRVLFLLGGATVFCIRGLQQYRRKSSCN